MSPKWSPNEVQLPLFQGAHIPEQRFRDALTALDLTAALRDCPPQWQEALQCMARATAPGPARADVPLLQRARQPGWPPWLEQSWQRLMGLALDSRGIPAVLDGEPAAAFLLRGGDPDRARASLLRHLARHPRDPAAWQLWSTFEPFWGTVRCGFHGGPLLDGADEVLEAVDTDDLAPEEPWLLSYAWLMRRLDLNQVEEAVLAEGLLESGQLPLPGTAHAFAVFLLLAEQARRAEGKPGKQAIEARRRMRTTSERAFQRYLRRVG